MKKKIEISVSKDTLKWFSKLTLTQKLKCVEEQIKTVHFLRKLMAKNGKTIYKRNNN